MSLLISLLLVWFGVAGPNQLADEAEAFVFEQVADPVDRWRPLVEEHFPADEIDTALCIIRHESGGDPEADNPRSSATGLFQILAGTWGDFYDVTEEQFTDPELNVELARDIWEGYGWGAWTTDRLCT